MFYKHAKVIIPPGIKPPPSPHERQAAAILAKHFNCSIEFLQPRPGYKMKTPDFIINGIAWELKCLQGKSKTHTIKANIRVAKKQSRYIIIDSRHTKLSDAFIIKQLTQLFMQKRIINKIILINKHHSVIDIKR